MLVDDDRGQRAVKAALTVGFLALAYAILRARAAPASNYELSIYGATPATVWVGIGVAFLVAVGVVTWGGSRQRGWLVPAALSLVTGGIVVIVALPLIRSYRAYGVADALTHLGWARGIANGTQSVLLLVYPGTHAFAGTISALTGMTVSRSMLLIILLCVTIFLVFIPLCVRTLVGDRMATVIATFSAAFLLPITNISTFIDFHPYTLTTFFFPLVLFLLFKYLADARRGSGLRNATSATGLILIVAIMTSILFHPQVALNVLIFFSTIVVVQRTYRWLPSGSVISEARSALAPTLAGFAFFAIWILRQPKVYVFLGNLATSVAGFVGIGPAATGSGAAQAVTSQTGSISGIGASLPELFAKLFLVHAVFAALAAVLVLVALSGRLGERNPDRNAAVTYFAYSGLTLTPFFLIQFVGSISSYFFRHFGFGMVIVTILGAITLHAIYTATRGGRSSGVLKTLAVAGVLVALLLSTLVIFPSPYIYKPTQHVSDQMMSGHEMAFEHRAADVPFAGIRKGPNRFADAEQVSVPTLASPKNGWLMNESLRTYHNQSYYLIVTEYNKKLEMGAYNGLRYNESGFEGIKTAPGVSLVQASNGMNVYYVEGVGDRVAPGGAVTEPDDGTFVGGPPTPNASDNATGSAPTSGNFGGGGGGGAPANGSGDAPSSGNFGGGGGAGTGDGGVGTGGGGAATNGTGDNATGGAPSGSDFGGGGGAGDGAGTGGGNGTGGTGGAGTADNTTAGGGGGGTTGGTGGTGGDNTTGGGGGDNDTLFGGGGGGGNETGGGNSSDDDGFFF
ncbi:hypothetical protein [Halomarina pelagica]|uniref:hypothetical protein n=1 Tax=Halomarina pelagica TaxID=2961599 RepID=UPI0020C5242E|nr:hypothetical protein [Halomarina sp. BND7]